jgi:hypothetical protein
MKMETNKIRGRGDTRVGREGGLQGKEERRKGGKIYKHP